MVEQTKMVCPSCGAPMQLSGDKLKLICSYCGYSQLVQNSDEIIKEQIRSDAFVKVSKERLHLEDARKSQELEKEEHQKFQKSVLFSFIFGFMFISTLAGIISFEMGGILPGIVAILQIVLLLLAALSGSGIIKTKRERLPSILTIISALMILLFLECSYRQLEKSNRETLEATQAQTYLWPTNGLALLLPEPPTQYGEISTNSSEEFQITLYQVTPEDYQNYARACENAGFTVDETADSESMRAHNKDGYYLVVYYQTYNGQQIFISVQAPIRMSAVDWNAAVAGSAGECLPEPIMAEGEDGKICVNIPYAREAYITIYAKMTKEQYAAYADACMEAGFNKNYSRDERNLYAYNADGYSLQLRYRGNNVAEIYVNSPQN